MLLNKQTLDIADICSRDETRPALNGLRVTRKFVEATDGHKLVRVTLPAQNDEDYPKIKGFKPLKRSKNTEVIIDRSHVTDIKKSIPKLKAWHHPPILAHAQIDFHGANSSVRVATTDLDKSNITEYRTIEGPFPNTERSIPKTKPKIEQDVGAGQLIAVLELAGRYCSLTHRVKLGLVPMGDGQYQITIKAHDSETGQDFYGLVMPLRTAV